MPCRSFHILVVDNFELLKAGVGGELSSRLIEALGLPQLRSSSSLSDNHRPLATSKGRPMALADRVQAHDPVVLNLNIGGLVLHGRYILADEGHKVLVR